MWKSEYERTEATAVATVLGFCTDIDGLGATGFRLNWRALEISGAFNKCECIGDLVKVYAAHVSRGI